MIGGRLAIGGAGLRCAVMIPVRWEVKTTTSVFALHPVPENTIPYAVGSEF